MQSPKLLIVIGVLVFATSLYWMYSQERGGATGGSTESQVNDTLPSADTASPAPATVNRQPPAQSRPAIPSTSDRAAPVADVSDYQPPVTDSSSQRADDVPDYPDAQLSISGRVLGPDGTPRSGIKLVARREGQISATAETVVREARSDASGAYEIKGLGTGDYNVRTQATARYPAAGSIFRAGMKSADIVLTLKETVQIHGKVTDAADMPLAGVAVRPNVANAIEESTDSGGFFRTQVPRLQGGGTYVIRFELPGYLEESAYLSDSKVSALGEARLDVQLMRLEDGVKVSGIVRGDDGTLVAGEFVQLDSPSLNKKYRATSQPDGTFFFKAVEPGGDYRLSVHPRGPYESYTQQAINIQLPSALLPVTLQPLQTGRISGQMVNADGHGVGGFTMWLRSRKSQSSYVKVVGDDSGFFAVENAPAGDLSFESRSQPQLRVSGITLEPGDSTHAELVLDWGDNEFSGRVRDKSRRPVSGASVQLTGQYDGRGIRSNSQRRTTTDSDGNFRFSELGGGMHTLSVRMQGYENATRAVDTGALLGNVEIELVRVGN